MFKMKLALGALSLLALGACAGPSQGVWWVELDLEDAATCSQSVAHNFADASVAAEAVDEDPWERETAATQSGAGFFALVTQDPAGLIWTHAGEVLQGTQEGKSWSLEGEAWEQGTRSDSHPDGYVFNATESLTSSTKVEFTQDKGTLSGTWTLVSTGDRTYTESDDWAVDLAQASQTPAGTVLFLEDGTPASNSPDFEDCSSAPCSLSVLDTCSRSGPVKATLTELEPGDFEGIAEAGYASGL
ncbi:MAG: hypothetical protein ACI9VR_003132 [Cognaticolwellia sp.]|jgi:hypothetical protein